MIEKKTTTYALFLLLTLFVAVSCSQEATLADNTVQAVSNVVTCSEPRAQMCTREYRPVCATLQNGKQKTYANGCEACADSQVKAYTPDACAIDTPVKKPSSK